MKVIQIVQALVVLLFTQHSFADFIVQEWGTFTSLVGSDGRTQPGLYHEDEELPSFVHKHGITQEDIAREQEERERNNPRRCRGKLDFDCDFLSGLRITQKMETPVLYFYSDKTLNASVEIDFPEGIVTDTFPAPTQTFPKTITPDNVQSGKTRFDLMVHALESFVSGLPPFVSPSNIYAHARNVKSNLIQIGNEVEKFIFYRGMGRFNPRIEITSQRGNVEIAQCRNCDEISAAFLVHVDVAGKSNLMRLGSLPANLGRRIISAEVISQLEGKTNGHTRFQSGEGALAAIHGALVNAGLSFDEATAMVKTWEHGYLKTPGLRLLYILPRGEVDQMLPIKITPTPDHLNRVFVGRIEIMRDTDEYAVLGNVLVAQDLYDVSQLGRMAEPKLRRAKEVYIDMQRKTKGEPVQETLELFDRLIQKAIDLGRV